MLNIVIPVSTSDIAILPDLVNAMVKFGGLEGHKITVFPTPSVTDEAADVTQPLASLVQAGNLVQAPLPSEPEQGWPIGPNQHFVAVMNYMMQMNSQLPFLWLEPDCCPVAPWANPLETEYNKTGRPFMGHMRETSEVIKSESGKHMVAGGAIFAADVWKRFTWWFAAAQRYDLPFDIFLRWEFLGAGANHPRCHDTKLVQHCPRSRGFFKGGNGIEGIPEAPAKNFTVYSDTVLVHGCKDGSLSKLVCEHAEYGGPPAKLVKEREQMTEAIQAAPSIMGAPIDLKWKQTLELPEVSAEDQKNEGYLAIWNVIKDWSILVPGNSFATSSAKPGHVALIMQGLMTLSPEPVPGEVRPQPSVGQPTQTRTPEQYLVELLVESPKNEMKSEDAKGYLKVDAEYFQDMVEQSKGVFKFSGPGDFYVRLTPKGLKMTAK